MSKQHPIERYINLKAGDSFTATGTADRHWPIRDHLSMNMRGRCGEADDSRLAVELSDEANQLSGRGSAVFLVEGSEKNTSSDDGNTLHASGKFGPLSFEFDDNSVHYEEARNHVLEVTADGRLDVLGPVAMHARVTLQIWKVAADVTRIRFIAVRSIR